ncbi:hypothetical protein [Aliivibrio wodanis]|uniref:hypothetical protein n=1 Tax=Aliivibrio wodanis TaxID=80852 RepID=UPI00406C66B3
MARFTFEVCQLNQVEELVDYIDNYWAKNHILVTSRKLLDWQHKSKQGDYYNFVMARHNKTGEICGVLGFIPTSHFSEGLQSEKEAWLAIWKVNEGPKFIGLGLGLLNFLKREFDIKNICSIGISQIVFPMYQTLGFKVGQLSQLALINTQCEHYSIAKIPDDFSCNPLNKTTGYEVDFIAAEQLESQLSDVRLFYNKTQKDKEYFFSRFVKHPKFIYRFLGIYREQVLVAFMVLRTVSYSQSTALRVVDIQGDLTSVTKVSHNLFNLLVAEQHEYLDIMQFGMDEVELVNSGFIQVSGDAIIIPDYFQPFVQENISIFFARKTSEKEKSFILFKGDADQDRPNII